MNFGRGIHQVRGSLGHQKDNGRNGQGPSQTERMDPPLTLTRPAVALVQGGGKPNLPAGVNLDCRRGSSGHCEGSPAHCRGRDLVSALNINNKRPEASSSSREQVSGTWLYF